MKIATHFSKITDDDINNLVISPPYEPNKDKLNQWVRGSIRCVNPTDQSFHDLVVTGPKMTVCFGGCKWNRLVFGIPKTNDGSDVSTFREWLQKISKKLEKTVTDSYEKFKPGSRSASRFTFDDDHVKPSSDPERYPDELRCRLSTIRREMTTYERDENDGTFDPSADHSELIDADIFTVTDNVQVSIDPTTITARSSVIPVIRISYYRHCDKFGLVLTVTKGQYFPNDNYTPKVLNSEWILDVPAAKKPRMESATAVEA